MKVTLYTAISIDGFIARKEGDTDWVNDWDSYSAAISQSDCIIYGRKTYDQMMANNEFPYENIHNLVYTRTPLKYQNIKKAEFTNLSPENLVASLSKKGFKNLLISGGGETNATFLNDGVVDEIITDVHPLILSDGIKFIDSNKINVQLERLSISEIENGLTQIKYKVIKS